MKEIGNLIVIDVPKNYKEFRIKMGELQFNHNGITGRITGLESGGYEIIGLASEIDEKDAIQMLQMHGIILPADYDPVPALHGQIKRIYGMEITDTTDLLFLKRI